MEYVSVGAAREATGLRMICIPGVPTPWTEAAKGIFHIQDLDCAYAARREDEPQTAIADWAGDSSVPVVAYDNECLRTGWAEILLLAERLAPQPALIPEDPGQRAVFFGLCHEICGEMGFGWCYRLLMIQASLGHSEDGAFPSEVGAYLAGKYGFEPGAVARARQRVEGVLEMLSARIAGRRYFFDDLTAADVYWATFANLMIPLPEAELPAIAMARDAYTCRDAAALDAISEELRDHQRFVYENHLELPVPL